VDQARADNFALPITHYPLPITHYPLPITHYPLPITHYPLPITHYPLPITRHGNAAPAGLAASVLDSIQGELTKHIGQQAHGRSGPVQMVNNTAL